MVEGGSHVTCSLVTVTPRVARGAFVPKLAHWVAALTTDVSCAVDEGLMAELGYCGGDQAKSGVEVRKLQLVAKDVLSLLKVGPRMW